MTDGALTIYPEREIEKVSYEYGERIFMEICFDGSRYGGWQIQPNAVTVQEVVEKLLCRLYDYQKISLAGSSRTDAGVHAVNFAASFLAPKSPAIPVHKLKQALNRLLPNDIRIRSIKTVELKFHPRFDALGKAYTYVINCGDETPFSNHYSLHPKYQVEAAKINDCVDVLLGTHDYSSFVCSRSDIDDAVRTIYRIEAEKFGEYLCITYIGNGFLYKMIRCLTGALLQVGCGRMGRDELRRLLVSCDRTLAPTTAPACGLFLMKVFYEKPVMESFKLENVPFFI